MAKKKKQTAVKSSGKNKSKSSDLLDTNKFLGFAGSAFIQPQLEKIKLYIERTPTEKALIKIVIGQWGQNQSFAKQAITNDTMRRAVGDGLVYEGIKELMAINKIAGIEGDNRKVKGSDFLAVSIEGLNDLDTVNNDTLKDDELNGDDDDINGDDDDINGDDDDINGDDDIDTINEDEYDI